MTEKITSKPNKLRRGIAAGALVLSGMAASGAVGYNAATSHKNNGEMVVSGSEKKLAKAIKQGDKLKFLNGSLIEQLRGGYTRIVNMPIVEFENGKSGNVNNPLSMRYFSADHDNAGNVEVHEVKYDPTTMSIMIAQKGIDAKFIDGTLIEGADVGERTPSDAQPFSLLMTVTTSYGGKGGVVRAAEDFIAPPSYANNK